MPSLSPRRVLTLGLALLAAALLLTAVSGCHPESGGSGIDVSALERQLESVVARQLIAGEFYDRTVDVACVGTGDDLHYSCHVNATNPGLATQSWDISVACGPPAGDDTPRCFTPDGDALQ